MPKLKDLTGQVFGRLTVMGRADEDYVSPKGRRIPRWHCRCECDNEIDVVGDTLRRGNTRSCGCYKKELDVKSVKDLTGQVFGRLTVMCRADDRLSEKTGVRHIQWHCRCECGAECDVDGYSLRSGNTTSCGCYRKERILVVNSKDLTGQVFGRWTVLGRAADNISKCGNRYTQWICRCECGTERVVSMSNLVNGKSKSCGCLSRKVDDDLTGRQFGRWTVLKRAENYVSPQGKKKSQWLCECECGTVHVVSRSALVSGKSVSCGCLPKKFKSAYGHDLTGLRFGRWMVLEQVENYVSPQGATQSQWRCKCDCGVERIVSRSTLTSGKSKSCGCLHKDSVVKYGHDDLTGLRFGRLTVLNRVADEYPPRWKCECDCGNVVYPSVHHLISDKVKSCGCLQRDIASQRLDLVDMQFGQLHVISRASDYMDSSGRGYSRWNCRCECGRMVVVRQCALRSGHTTSCGCIGVSKLEYLVQQYLDFYNVQYSLYHSYPDLIGVGGKQLSYDFLIWRNDGSYCLIECQGKQHYVSVEYFGGNETFERQQEHDRRKREYAEKIGVPLIEIPYTADTYEKVAAILQEYGI